MLKFISVIFICYRCFTDVFQNAAESLLRSASTAAVEEREPTSSNDEDHPRKLAFNIDDLMSLLKLRDWEDRDDSAINFDGPKAEVSRRVAELLDRSDLEKEWCQTLAKK